MWIGIVVYFLAAYDAKLLVEDLSVDNMTWVEGAQPALLDVSVTCYADVTQKF